ncbi:MAG: PilN domain-containing protein [Armatimonadetes bacterium]|nr:PilN domain-containing protein [Armatimonadota bacterium]
MPSINMIAERRAAKKALETTTRKLFYLVGLEMLVALCLVSFMTVHMFSLRGHMADLEGQMTALEPTIHKIQSYEKSLAEIRPKTTLLHEAQENLEDWHSTLQRLSMSLPAETWLTTVEVADTARGKSGAADEGKDINFAGVSASQGLVGEAMLRLLDYPRFERIDLKQTQQRDVENRVAVEFQFTARLKPLHPEKKAEKEAATNEQS